MATTWNKMLKEICEKDGEEFANLKVFVEKDGGMDKPFDNGFGGSEGPSFTAWGEKWVYFPIVYDGAEWIGHAPRNPCEIAMDHQGGE